MTAVLRTLLTDRLARAAILAATAWVASRWAWAPSAATVDTVWGVLLGLVTGAMVSRHTLALGELALTRRLLADAAFDARFGHGDHHDNEKVV